MIISYDPKYDAIYLKFASGKVVDTIEVENIKKKTLPSQDGIIVMSLDELRKEQRMAAAAKLFEMGKLLSGAAARLAGVPRTVFLAGLAKYAVDIFRLTEDEEVTQWQRKILQREPMA